eukprot:COSAG02_NODE_43314_length_376_cov_0.559567_1_plen_103_part_01
MSGRSTRELLAAGAVAATLAAAFYTCAPVSSQQQQAQKNELRSRQRLGIATLSTKERRGMDDVNSSWQQERKGPELPLQGTRPPTNERVHEPEAMFSASRASS